MSRFAVRGILFLSFFCYAANATVISGTVTDSVSGSKLTNVIISVSGQGLTTIRDTTDAAGAYSLPETKTPGSFTARATVSGYTTKSTTITIDTAQATMTLNFAIVKIDTATVSGVITDSASGTPITGAIVTTSGNRRDTTKADGKYTFEKMASGSYTVAASAASYVGKNATVAVSGTDTVKANIALAKIAYATVSGTISDSATGSPLANAVVSLRTTNGTLKVDTTKADGKYSFDSVATGSYTVRATATGYNSRTSASTTVNGAAVSVNVALVKISYGSIYGIIADSVNGTPITGAIVTTSGRRDTTKSDGVFSFDSLAVGTYSLGVSASYYNGRTVNTTVASSGTDTANVKLLKIVYGTVSGTISDSVTTGTFVANAIVTIRANYNSPVRIDTTKADGKYSFDSVAVGSYSVSVTSKVYNGKTATANVTSTATVTVDFALIKTLFGTVLGTITDSASGTALKGATVTVRQGGTVIKTGTTDVDGKYSLDSIPIGVYTVRASDSLYTTKSVTDSVKTAVTDTTNFKLTKATNAVIVVRKVTAGSMGLFVSTFGEIVLKNKVNSGEIKLFGLNGKLLYKTSFTEQTNRIILPKAVVSHGNTYVVRVNSGNSVYQKNIVLP